MKLVGITHLTRSVSPRVLEMARVFVASILMCAFSNASFQTTLADEADTQLDARFLLEQAEEQAFKEAAVLASPSIVRIATVGG